jgi:hypothetical protein
VSSERITELKRLIKAAANRSEEVRCQIEVLYKRDNALRDDVGRYVAELKELTGELYPVTVNECAPDREARKLPRVASTGDSDEI